MRLKFARARIGDPQRAMTSHTQALGLAVATDLPEGPFRWSPARWPEGAVGLGPVREHPR